MPPPHRCPLLIPTTSDIASTENLHDASSRYTVTVTSTFTSTRCPCLFGVTLGLGDSCTLSVHETGGWTPGRKRKRPGFPGPSPKGGQPPE